MFDVSAYEVGQKLSMCGCASLNESMTTPPRPFVEGDLVDIMDDIGRYAEIGKDDMAILRNRNRSGSGKAGIGTARTRGEIIKKLFKTGFIDKIKGRKNGGGIVVPTDKGILLFQKLSGCGVAQVLVSPEMTAKWEVGLEKIESGEITVAQFMGKLEAFVEQMVVDMTASPTNPLYGKSPGESRAPAEPVEPHPMHGEDCPKCGKGKLVTGKVTSEKSKAFGKRYVRCDAGKEKCDFFGEFIE